VTVTEGGAVKMQRETTKLDKSSSSHMIGSVHLLQYSRDPAADRAFLRDVLGWPNVADDSEEGWLIFALPPTELAVHPTDGESVAEIHLMCDDIDGTVEQMKRSGVEVTSEIEDGGYGLGTGVRLPSGAEIGLHEPHHRSPLELSP
jgi:predicted enzyme related to lactoylglutathione lyase